MPNIMTADDVRSHIETDLADGALQMIIDAVDAEIIRKLGDLASQAEVLQGGQRYLHLARKASSISAVSERYSVDGIGYTTLDLNATDYRLLGNSREVERLFTGPHASSLWKGEVLITYVPADAGVAERKILMVNLIKLELKYSAVMSESIGDARVQHVMGRDAERASLFRVLQGGARRIIA